MIDMLRELHERQNKLWAEAKEVMGRAEKDGNRAMNTEERSSYDKLFEDISSITETMQRKKDAAEFEARMQAPEPRQVTPQTPEPGDVDGNAAREMDPDSFADDALFKPDPENRAWDKPEYVRAWPSYLRRGDRSAPGILRALSAGSDSAGGFTVTTEFARRLIKGMDNATPVRGLATKFPLPKAESMGVPTLSADPADIDWTTELGTGSEDSTMAFGKRELFPHPMAKRLKVSRTLMRQSFLNIERLVRDRLGYKARVTQENGFLNGDGAGEPLGAYVASADGISTSRDVSTDMPTDGFTFDGLIAVKYTLHEGYLPAARWNFHRDGVKKIALLKDGEGRYLWQPSVVGGEPARILDLPYFMSAYTPNTFTTGQYVGMLADWGYYWIADALNMTIEVLWELYAETNQAGFILRQETDGMPVLEDAFVRIKTG